MPRLINLLGKRIGRLTVLSRAENHVESGRVRVMWLCRCDCGNLIRTRAHSLCSGHTLSCGCLRIELLKANPQVKKETNPEVLARRQQRRSMRAFLRWIDKQYGLSQEGYSRMLKQQEGKCAICDKVFDGDVNIDHDHATNEVRKLLCRNCNHLLGNARDNIRILERAIDYLEAHKCLNFQ